MDREKVIKSLKWFRDRDSWREGIMIHDDHAEVRKQICDNAIELLKEQEEMLVEYSAFDGMKYGGCPRCNARIDNLVNPKACGYCGQAVKWE